MIGFGVYRLRVRLYRRWKFHPFDRDDCVGEDMDYDVFLCCSSEDHNPHGRRILELLESKGYRVCYHLRNFLAGAAITENMIQAIERSKRTVCLVSRNFLARYSWEFLPCGLQVICSKWVYKCEILFSQHFYSLNCQRIAMVVLQKLFRIAQSSECTKGSQSQRWVLRILGCSELHMFSPDDSSN